jgi:hypothetical protein
METGQGIGAEHVAGEGVRVLAESIGQQAPIPTRNSTIARDAVTMSMGSRVRISRRDKRRYLWYERAYLLDLFGLRVAVLGGDNGWFLGKGEA